jgi:phytoene dehydrogenase-like protein
MSNKILIMGGQVQGLISACLMAKRGMQVHIAQFGFESDDYKEFADGYKIGPVTHVPFSISQDIIDELDLESHSDGNLASDIENPFKALPFYDGLKELLKAFRSLDDNRPAYKEKAWRDAWGTFELGRILAGYDKDIQSLFAQSTTLSLSTLLDAIDIDDTAKAKIIAQSIIGSRTDAQAKGSAASILPAMAPFENNGILIQGSLHPLLRTLKQIAMTHGVQFTEGQTIASIEQSNGEITSVTTDGGETLTADYFVLDCDPVVFFDTYGSEFSMPPAFRNRVLHSQNLRESIHVQLAVSALPDTLKTPQIIAPSVDYITSARSDFKRDGGSQLPMCSIINVTHNNGNFAPDGHYVLDVLSHYFDPTMADDAGACDAQITTTIQALDTAYPNFSESIIESSVQPMNSQGGQANFTGTMALLQLFKVFFGHHAMGYDIPFQNMLVAGYGNGACAHYHVYNGGARVANLLHSISNNAT